MTTVFVAGATGYTGQNVVAQLRSVGVETIAHIRPDSGKLAQWEARFTALGAKVSTAAWTLDEMTAAFAEAAPTHVFALIGTTRARRSSEEVWSYEAIDYGLTSLLINACLATRVESRFVYLSSLGASSTTASPYLKARFRVESELIASGLEYVIARPSFISGPDRDESRPMERVGATFVDGALSLAGALGLRSVQEKYASLTGAELASGLIHMGLGEQANRIVDTTELRQWAVAVAPDRL